MRKFLFLIPLILSALSLSAAQPLISVQPIHEAYVLRISDPVPQEIITKQPPAPIEEIKPTQPNAQTIWIPGYWAWVREKQDFVWICGIWRLPPPDHIWSTCYWLKMKDGWTWVRGAWMPDQSKAQSSWIYSQKPPPAAQNEETGASPGPDYFWLSGYWEYDSEKADYQWLSGSWQKFNPKWILEAAHWVWRPEGYLFVPTYWDWTLDVRGTAYDCKTQKPLEPKTVAQQLISYYPDYIAECCHCRHYQPQYWEGCECIPAWWGWSDWWALPWHNHWWLWWWWLNPNYPAPPFIPVRIIDLIPPPRILIIDMFGPFPAPIFITPFGVPTLLQWIDVINRVLGGNNGPFIPQNRITVIIDAFDGVLPKTTNKKPSGKPNGEQPKKPESAEKLKPASGTATLPGTPKNVPPTPPVVDHTDQSKKMAPIPQTPTNTPPQTPVPEPEHTQPVPQPQYNPPTYSQPQYEPQYIPSDSGGYYGNSYGGSYGGYYGNYGSSYGGYYGDYGGSYGGYYGNYGGHHGGGDYGGHHGGGDYGGHHGGGDYGGHHGGGDYGGHHGGGGSYGGHHGGGGGGHGGHHGHVAVEEEHVNNNDVPEKESKG